MDIGQLFAGRRWLAHLAVVPGYALAYWVVTHALVNAPWAFTSALRIACLLLIPYRYWPALVLGEAVPLIYRNVACLDDFGLTWVIVASIPSIAVAMPVVWWFRSRAALFPARHLVDITKLVCCTLILAVLWAVVSYAALATIRLPTGPYRIPDGASLALFFGNYMPLLVVVPWLVMIRIQELQPGWRPPSFRSLAVHPRTRDVAIAVLVLATLLWLHRTVVEIEKPITVIAMFLPAAWLTFKRGWRASVLGGTLSILAASFVMEWRPDAGMLQIQALLAFVITGMYVLGARISAQLRQHDQLQLDAKESQQVAQDALSFGEHRMQQTSQALECVAKVLSIDYGHMVDRFVPDEEKTGYSKLAMQMQQNVHRLAESIHPSAWRERGVAAALDETIGDALCEAGIVYTFVTSGRGLRTLRPALRAAVYRVACEAVTWLSTSPACSDISVIVRTGRDHGTPWVALRLDSARDASHVASAMLHALERQRLAPKLGARMHALNELEQFVRLYGGKLRHRHLPGRVRIFAVLRDESVSTSDRNGASIPIRLWVG